MFRFNAYILIQGTNINPNSPFINADLSMSNCYNTKEMRDIDQNKGITIPNYDAIIITPQYIGHNDKIQWLLDYLADRIEKFRTSGGKKFILYYDCRTDLKLSINLSRNELKQMSDLGVSFFFSVNLCLED